MQENSKLNEYLIFSVKIGNVECLKHCIENGADVRADDDYALRWASENGHYDIVKLLLENGANVHANDDAALRWASKKGHYNVVKLLEKYMDQK